MPRNNQAETRWLKKTRFPHTQKRCENQRKDGEVCGFVCRLSVRVHLCGVDGMYLGTLDDLNGMETTITVTAYEGTGAGDRMLFRARLRRRSWVAGCRGEELRSLIHFCNCSHRD
jgi:hypothetical protein